MFLQLSKLFVQKLPSLLNKHVFEPVQANEWKSLRKKSHTVLRYDVPR